MKKATIPLLILCLLFSACQKEESSAEYAFEAEVLGRNLDCGLYEIKIVKGLPQAEEIAGPTGDEGIYVAKNLPSQLETIGLKILLDVREIQNNELTPCTTLGISRPWLYVEKKKKN